MKLIVGLGNPGEKYQNTRHNVGFWAVDKLREFLKLPEFQETSAAQALATDGKASGEKIIILKPMTFMNLSGEAVGAVMRYYKIKSEDVWVVMDDLYHEVGTLRVRQGGSAGGHNGLKSVIAHIGENFWRYRIGVGPQPENVPAENFVLANLDKKTKTDLEIAVVNTVEKILDNLKNAPKDETIKF